MHDPLTVIFEIRRPWPKLHVDRRKNPAGWKPEISLPFVRWRGREAYFPGVITVWHRDTEADGSDDACLHAWLEKHTGNPRGWSNLTGWRDFAWRKLHAPHLWHLRHWKIQVRPVQDARRWLFTRCEGCGERFPWGYAPVRKQHGHEPHTRSVMLGETCLYHWDCEPEKGVEHRNTDSWDRQWGHDVYLRRTVLNEPVDVAVELASLRQVAKDAEERYRRRLWESRREHGMDFEWKFPREQEARS